jgi:hypothetical protein
MTLLNRIVYYSRYITRKKKVVCGVSLLQLAHHDVKTSLDTSVTTFLPSPSIVT